MSAIIHEMKIQLSKNYTQSEVICYFPRFLGVDSPDTFFLDKDRQRIVYEILATSVYGKRKRAEVGIDRLLEEEVYLAAYPLHDVSSKITLTHFE